MEDVHVLVLHFTPKKKSFVSQKFGGSTSESSGLRLIGLFQYIHKFALMYWARRKCPLLLTTDRRSKYIKHTKLNWYDFKNSQYNNMALTS